MVPAASGFAVVRRVRLIGRYKRSQGRHGVHTEEIGGAYKSPTVFRGVQVTSGGRV